LRPNAKTNATFVGQYLVGLLSTGVADGCDVLELLPWPVSDLKKIDLFKLL
jgi:hypothetical protein